MPLETDALYTCPSCGEQNALGVDPTGGRRQRLLEDCPVCCRPLVFSVVVDPEGDAVVERVERE
ncbi:MAG TPA: CPXCG motif-containing cysteine-rich protein [Candidatus Limnocylindrales bacterium]|nr:CPXCG motif-containing cysteine-rich protein [Candidatus Limnocylindrales bacterium]